MMQRKPDFEVPPTRLPVGYTQIMYGSYLQNKDGFIYPHHLFPSKGQVQMCGVEEDEIVKFKVREKTKNDFPTPHWGWEDFNDGKYSMIFMNYLLFSMCWPYGVEAEVKKGRGRPVNLKVEEIE